MFQAGRRVSSTNEKFLESESLPTLKPFVFDHNQPPDIHLPRVKYFTKKVCYLESSIEETETEDDVFFDRTDLLEEIMPPKTAPQLHDSFQEKVEEFNEISSIVEQTGKPPDGDTLGELDDLNKAKSLPNLST